MIIQNELENIRESINDIANNTELNTIKFLLPPSVQNHVPPKCMPGTGDIVFIMDKID